MKEIIKTVKDIVLIANGILILIVGLKSCGSVSNLVKNKATVAKEKVNKIYLRRQTSLMAKLRDLKDEMSKEGFVYRGKVGDRAMAKGFGANFDKNNNTGEDYYFGTHQAQRRGIEANPREEGETFSCKPTIG